MSHAIPFFICLNSQKGFWDVLTSSLTRFEFGSDVVFPLWLISHLVELSDYEMNGAYIKETKKDFSGPNAYTYVSQLLHEWRQDGRKTNEVHQLVHRLLPYWGSDLGVVLALWGHWFPKIDKGFEGMDTELILHYTSHIPIRLENRNRSMS